MVELRLLGPVEIGQNGCSVEIGPPQRRSVLAALAVDAGRPVSVTELVRRVWDEDPPDRARRALHAHIARIRRLMEQISAGQERPMRLIRRGGEYVLDVQRELVDMHRFRCFIEQANKPGQTAADRVVALRRALELWRGEPLRGLGTRWAARMRENWQQHRLDAQVAWAQAELRYQPTAPIISTLYELVTEHPLAEPLVAALMRALHAGGRRAEAVDCYAVTRRRLADQLGVEPGPELRELHRELLLVS